RGGTFQSARVGGGACGRSRPHRGQGLDARVSAAQRDKGARAELEVAKIFQAAGFDCNRVPSSGGLRIKGDLYGDVPAHVESKWQAVIRLPEGWRQTRDEAPPGVLPVLA